MEGVLMRAWVRQVTPRTHGCHFGGVRGSASNIGAHQLQQLPDSHVAGAVRLERVRSAGQGGRRSQDAVLALVVVLLDQVLRCANGQGGGQKGDGVPGGEGQHPANIPAVTKQSTPEQCR